MLSGFVLAGLEYCSAVWCALQIHTVIKLLDRAVSAALFLTVGEFECDIAHGRGNTVYAV